MAQEGKIEEAIAKFKLAMAWDMTLQFDPKTKANQIYAPVLVSEGEELALQGPIEQALANYTQAPQLDPDHISAESWDTLCWFGHLYQQAEKVTTACGKAMTGENRGGQEWLEEKLMEEEIWK